MNSMGDAGAVLCGGVWLMWITHKKDPIVFKKWKWSAFSIFFIWCVSQNILVEMFLYLCWCWAAPVSPPHPRATRNMVKTCNYYLTII